MDKLYTLCLKTFGKNAPENILEKRVKRTNTALTIGGLGGGVFLFNPPVGATILIPMLLGMSFCGASMEGFASLQQQRQQEKKKETEIEKKYNDKDLQKKHTIKIKLSVVSKHQQKGPELFKQKTIN